MKRLARVLLRLALLGSLSGRAAAADPTQADSLFREGRALMQSGDAEGACRKFAESQELDPAPGTAVNLGDCSEKLGKLVAALNAYQMAFELLPANDPRIEPTRATVAELEKRVARWTIRLPEHAPPGTGVKVDGRELAAAELDKEQLTDPGAHHLTLHAPGHTDFKMTITFAEGESRTSEPELGPSLEAKRSRPEPVSPNTPEEPRIDESATRRTAVLVGVGGLVVAALGGVALVQAHREKSDSDDAHLRGDDATGSSKYDSAKRWQTISIVAFALGGAALTTGSAIWLSAGSGGNNASARFSELGVQLHGRW